MLNFGVESYTRVRLISNEIWYIKQSILTGFPAFRAGKGTMVTSVISLLWFWFSFTLLMLDNHL